MSAALSVRIKGQPAQKVVIGPTFTIGRDAGSDWVLDDARVSRSHAMIRRQQDGRYCVVDLGSANGTYLNEQRITRPTALQAGDVVQIANCQIRLLVATEEAGPLAEPDSIRTLDDHRECNVAVLVVDIRGYTRLAETLPPRELSELLGRWFQDTGRLIQKHGGSVDKFIGDAVLAFWLEKPDANPSTHVLATLTATQEILGLARSYDSRVRTEHPDLRFEVGCGVGAGQAAIGNIGLDARRDFTIIGDCVNIAFRLESLCGQMNRPGLVTEDVRNAARDHFRFEDLSAHQCRGKSIAVHVFALLP